MLYWIEFRKMNCVLVVWTVINLFPCVSEFARRIVSYELQGAIIYIQDIQWFDVEYGIFLMRRQDILYFHECESRVKIFKKSCLTSEINSIFNIKSIEFSVLIITFSLVFEHVSYKSLILRAIHHVMSQ